MGKGNIAFPGIVFLFRQQFPMVFRHLVNRFDVTVDHSGIEMFEPRFPLETLIDPVGDGKFSGQFPQIGPGRQMQPRGRAAMAENVRGIKTARKNIR